MKTRRLRSWSLAFAASSLALPAFAGDGFGGRYETNLERTEPPVPLEWTCDEQDVWRIDGLDVTRGSELRVVLGPSTVVFGVHASNVVWAAVTPDAPGTISGRLAGAKERPTSVWLRFHPSKFDELFPKARVEGQGKPEGLVWGRRLAASKMSGGWYADGFPVVPTKRSLVVDCETVEGPRRYYSIDDEKHAVEYVQAFERRQLLPLVPMSSADALDAYDRAWAKFDATYAKFELRPEVDWDALKLRYRPIAEQATTSYEAGAAIALLVEHLRDLHVYVRASDEWCPQYRRVRLANMSWNATKALVGAVAEPTHEVAWGRTKDGIGYVGLFGLSDKEVATTVDRALDELGDTWGLIVDLRPNGGGDELLGRSIAARFVDKPRVYSQSRYRDDPKRRSSLGPPLPRTVEPRDLWRYAGPVAVLQGQKTMSSAESLALMFAQCPNVTTIGDRTAGASANPERLEMGPIVVNVPRWNDLDPKGAPIEDVGIAPKIVVKTTPASFDEEKDPVVSAALEHLRKTPRTKRKAAKGK